MRNFISAEKFFILAVFCAWSVGNAAESDNRLDQPAQTTAHALTVPYARARAAAPKKNFDGRKIFDKSVSVSALNSGASSSGMAIFSDGNGGAVWANLDYNSLINKPAIPTILLPSGPAGGDLAGTYPNPTVATIGGIASSNVANGVNLSLAATNANTVGTIVKRDANGNFMAGNITANLTGNVSGSAAVFTGNLAGDVAGAQTATSVLNVGGVTAANIASGATLANSATTLGLPNTLVKRDANGNFSSGIITGNVTGNVSGSAAAFTGNLAGDVSGTQTATSVLNVGGVSAANIASGANLANAATNSFSAAVGGGAIVRRDTTGGFSAGTITANLLGSSTSFTGPLIGDVTGSQSATVVSSVGGVNAASVANGSNAANAATTASMPDSIVKRDHGGNINATTFTGSLAGDVLGTQSVTVVSSVGGISAANLANGATLANAATPNATANALVKRDANGNFSVGTLTANLVGNVTGNVTGSVSNFSGQLFGDITGAQSNTVVSSVGGVSAANVAGGANLANAATPNLIAGNNGTIVKRDVNGGFSAGLITASLSGNVTGNVSGSATSFTGSLNGDVTGAQGATMVSSVGGSSAANIHTAEVLANAATTAGTPDSIVKRDHAGNIPGVVVGAVNLSGDVTGQSGSNTVASVGGVTAANVASGANLANAATTASTANTLVKRDSQGNIPGVVVGAVTLAGDVTGQSGTNTVTKVGGVTAANVASGANLANGATFSNVPNTLIIRDSVGAIGVSTLYGNVIGSVTGTASAFTGVLAGDVTGQQGFTVVSAVGGSTAFKLHQAELAANSATAANVPNTIVMRDVNGNFAANSFVGNVTGNVTGMAASFSNPLIGDVTGTQLATVVSSVGNVTAANVASGANAANAATTASTPNTVVKRDSSGNFSAGTVTAANFVGNGSGLTNVLTVPYTLTGDAGSGAAFAVTNSGVSRFGAGIRGNSVPGSGVYGNSTTGTGVQGNSDSGPGLYGTSNSASGVYGYSNSGSGVFAFGNNSYGIYAQSINSDAGHFEGNVSITGNTVMGGNCTITGNTSFGTSTRQMINLYDVGYGIGVQNSTFYQRCNPDAGFAWYRGGTHSDTAFSNGGGTTLMVLTAAGNLNVTATGNGGNAVYGNNPNGIGVYGRSNSGTSSTAGIWGENSATGGTGVVGNATNSSSTGVAGIADYALGTGVYGRGTHAGVSGYSDSGNGVTGDSANGNGVIGDAHQNNVAGVVGQNFSGANINFSGSVGVLGVSTNGWGVHGITYVDKGFAGFFDGALGCSTDFYCGGAKHFKIDHPLDPANKYLVHACIESPESKNLYDGTITTDANGDATINLPAYFEALNRDFRYQLTVIGQFAQAIVANKIQDNHFSIKTDKPNVEVSWQVTGIRHDAYMKAHPIVVEQDKPENERGTYQHPKLYGQPEEMSLSWKQNPELWKRLKAERLKRESTAATDPAAVKSVR